MLLHFTWSMLTVSLRSGKGGWEVSLREIYIWLKVCFFPVFLKVAVTAHNSEEQVKKNAEMHWILIRAPEVPFSEPPKTPKMGNFGCPNQNSKTTFQYKYQLPIVCEITQG